MYITCYISKLDKTQNMSWRDILRALDREMQETVENEENEVDRQLHRDIYEVVKRLVADREMTAQEAALDALGLPLIQYSCSIHYVRAAPPDDTYVKPRRKGDRMKRRRTDNDPRQYLYDPPVTKYVLRTYPR